MRLNKGRNWERRGENEGENLERLKKWGLNEVL